MLQDAATEVDCEHHAIGSSASSGPMALTDFFPGAGRCGAGSSSLSSLAGLPPLNAQPTPNQLEREKLPDEAAHDYLTDADPNNPR